MVRVSFCLGIQPELRFDRLEGRHCLSQESVLGVLECLKACPFQCVLICTTVYCPYPEDENFVTVVLFVFVVLFFEKLFFFIFLILLFFLEALSVVSALNYNSRSSHTSADNKYSALGLIYRRSLAYLYQSTVPSAKTSL